MRPNDDGAKTESYDCDAGYCYDPDVFRYEIDDDGYVIGNVQHCRLKTNNNGK